MATYSLPPAIGYSLPAFKQSQSGNIKVLFEYPIDFNKNNITQNAKDVKIECKIINNNNYDIQQYFTSKLYDLNSGTWANEITIPKNLFNSVGIYKIQLRFYINNGNYSEWSSICYVKCISNNLSIQIINFTKEDIVTYTVTNDSPSFVGAYSSSDE
jgi:hypothetical protein